jgi:hypothetical protein
MLSETRLYAEYALPFSRTEKSVLGTWEYSNLPILPGAPGGLDHPPSVTSFT